MQIKPLVSIILPIRNEEESISLTLESILNQDYDKNKVEIIIADGLSTDGTLPIIREFQLMYRNIKIIENKKKTVPGGFNNALNICRGEVVIRVDGHTILSSDYVTKCVRSLEEKKADNVGGLMTPKSNSFIGNLVSLATSSRFGIGNSYFHFSKIGRWVDTVYLGAWKRDVFSKIGGFDEDLVRNQDDEFNFRLIQSGGRIWLNPEIKSIYKPRNSLIKLVVQYFQYGFYKVRVMQKRAGISSIRQLIPPAFVISLILSLIMSLKTFIPFLTLISFYLIFNVSFTVVIIFEKIRKLKINPFSIFIFLPFIFFSIHVSYGMGYLLGLAFFFKHWGDVSTSDTSFDLDAFKNNYQK